jgi:iron complex outermembrane receptor protein
MVAVYGQRDNLDPLAAGWFRTFRESHPELAAMIARTLILVASAAALSGTARAQREQGDTAAADTLKPVLLEPVIVSVTRHPASLSQVPFAVAVVGREEITRGRSTVSLDEVLNTVPGLLVANRYNPSQDERISIRGFGARSAFGVRGVKILLDGIPQTLPDGQGQLNNIDLSDVTRIEILRGPSSSLYGNASGGVISLYTDRDFPRGLVGETRVLAGSYELFKWQGNVSAPLGRGALSFSASRTAWQGYRQHSEADTRRLAARVSQPLSGKSTLVFHGMLVDSPWLEDPGALTLAEMQGNPAQANPRNLTAGPEGAGKAVTQAQGGVAFRRSFPNGGSLEVAGFGLVRDLKNQLPATYIELDRLAYGGRASISLPQSLGALPHVVTAGIDLQWQRDDRINRSPDRSALTRDQFEGVVEVGPFVQSQLTVARRVTLTAGARYDRVAFTAEDRLLSDGDDSGRRVMASWSGSGGLLLDLGEPVQPYINLSTSFETPTTTELANRPSGPGGFNPELGPQRAVNYEVGLRGRLADRVQYSLAAFQADVSGELIPFEVPGEPGRRFFRNAGSSRHRGLEAGFTARLPFGVTLLAAYTLSDYRFVDFKTGTAAFDGNRIPGVPLHQLHWSARYQSRPGYWIALDNTHVSSYYVDDANTQESRVRPWTNTALRLGGRTAAGRWELKPFLGVSNLFDRRYAASAVVNAQFGRYYEPAPGRNFYLGFELGARAP